MDMHQVEILPTSKVTYISFEYALNLHSEENGPTGDWHFEETFYVPEGQTRKISLAGEGTDFNTNHIFSDYGIYECTETLHSYGLITHHKENYACNFFRACLDMLFKNLLAHELKYIFSCVGISEEYFDTYEEKAFLLNNALKIREHVPLKYAKILEEWVKREAAAGDYADFDVRKELAL